MEVNTSKPHAGREDVIAKKHITHHKVFRCAIELCTEIQYPPLELIVLLVLWSDLWMRWGTRYSRDLGLLDRSGGGVRSWSGARLLVLRAARATGATFMLASVRCFMDDLESRLDWMLCPMPRFSSGETVEDAIGHTGDAWLSEGLVQHSHSLYLLSRAAGPRRRPRHRRPVPHRPARDLRLNPGASGTTWRAGYKRKNKRSEIGGVGVGR